MERSNRRSGIPPLGNIPWGTHMCHFYQSPDELVELLASFFRAGLESDEFCVWITAGPVSCTRAESALRAAVRDFDARLASGQMVIIPAEATYLEGGRFDSRRMVNNWISKLTDPKAHGFCGARGSGDTWWLDRAGWHEFQKYESLVDAAVRASRALVLCTYPIDKCAPDQIFEAVRNHGIALIRRNGAWETIHNPGRLHAREAARESRTDYETLTAEMETAFAYQEVICDARGEPVDIRFLEINEGVERLTGWKRGDVIGRRGTELMPWLPEEWVRRLCHVGITGEPDEIERTLPDGRRLGFSVYSPRRGYVAVMAREILDEADTG